MYRMFGFIGSSFRRRNLLCISQMNSVKHKENQMKIGNNITVSGIVIILCTLVIKMSVGHPGHVHHDDFVLEYPSPIFSSRADAEWNGQILVFPTSSKRGINPWIEDAKAMIRMQTEVKSAGRGEAIHVTQTSPIPHEKSTDVLKVDVPRVTVTSVSDLHHRTTDLVDKRVNLDTKEIAETKKGNKEQNSRQPTTSPPTTDTIVKLSPRWLNSGVQVSAQPPVITSTVISMTDKFTFVDQFHRFLSKSGNDNGAVSKTREPRPSDVTHVNSTHIRLFYPEGKVNKNGGVSDIFDRGSHFKRKEAMTVDILNIIQTQDKNLSNEATMINKQTVMRPENSIRVKEKATTKKLQRLGNKKEEQHSTFPIRHYHQDNSVASANPVDRKKDAPSKDSGQLKALNLESTSGRKLVSSLVNVEDLFFFLNHSNLKDEIIKGSKTLNHSNVITSVNDESWSDERGKPLSHQDNKQMYASDSKQQHGLAVTERIKQSQGPLDLLHQSNLWPHSNTYPKNTNFSGWTPPRSLIDIRSNLSSNIEALGKQPKNSSKESTLVDKMNLKSQHQISSLKELRKTTTSSTTVQTPYSTMVLEISSNGSSGNDSFPSIHSLPGQSNTTVNDTYHRNVYNRKKYERKGTSLQRPEFVPELRELYVESKGMFTIKPNSDTKSRNQIRNWIRKESEKISMNSTSHTDRPSKIVNLVNETIFETEMHTYSGKLETLYTKDPELTLVLDAHKSYSDSKQSIQTNATKDNPIPIPLSSATRTVNWMQSTAQPNDFSTSIPSMSIGGTSTSNSGTTVSPQTTVSTRERTTTNDRELTEELLMYADLLRILNEISTLDSAMSAESIQSAQINAANGTPIPIVPTSPAKYVTWLQSTAQPNNLSTSIPSMLIRGAFASNSGTNVSPKTAVRSRERTTTMDRDLIAELLIYAEIMRTLNEI